MNLMTRIAKILPGLILLGVLAYFTKQIEGEIKQHWKFGIDVLHLNAMMLAFVTGILLGNTVGTSNWLGDGVKFSATVLKTGVILLGCSYSFADLAKIGSGSLIIITFFVFATFFFVLLMGRLFHAPRSITGVLACGCGICGVSAEIAAAPVVKASANDLAYCIGVTLGFGLVEVFTYPFIADHLNMTSKQFGAWAGTGILNTAQIVAVSTVYNEHVPGTLEQANIFNLTRTIYLPVLVLILAFMYMRLTRTGNSTESAQKINVMQTILDKFPVFILGFIAMVALRSAGVFGITKEIVTPKGIKFDDPAQVLVLKQVMMWCFAVGLIGLGMRTSFKVIKNTGGKPLLIGILTGLFKTFGALAAVLLFL